MFLFEQFSTSLQWIAETKLLIPGCAHILDDFLFVGPPHYNTCLSHLKKFLTMADALGVPMKPDKTVLPCTTITFVGIELDSVLMEKRLPAEKLIKIRHLLQDFKTRRKVKLVELQSLIGLLNFACSVVTPGRTFLRRIIDLTLGLQQPHHRRRLDGEARADLEACSTFVDHFNGKSMFLPDRSSLQCYSVLSDILVKNELCIPLERGSNVLSTGEGFICLCPPSKLKIAVLFCSIYKKTISFSAIVF